MVVGYIPIAENGYFHLAHLKRTPGTTSIPNLKNTFGTPGTPEKSLGTPENITWLAADFSGQKCARGRFLCIKSTQNSPYGLKTQK